MVNFIGVIVPTNMLKGSATSIFYKKKHIYDSLVLVSGGSGITPFFSIIREFIFRSAGGGGDSPTIHLICAFKTSADLTMLDLLLPISSDASSISRLQLHVDAFVTREKAALAADGSKQIRTVWFKPRPSDLPVSAALGPRSWLWLAAVISASFAAFLLLLGVLNRYYIYPIDKNTNKVYSYTARALLNLLLLCGCLGAAAAAAFFWNKRAAAYSVDTRQVQSMDGPTPAASPGSWFYNADRELESLPQESLVRSTNVHFGSRPDLKKMLLELDGPNTGVLVSGPREMRRDVARICSSGLAENLHYESMSFSW
ncbi:hypothetical protein Taro_000817 [Colocasia esculenta]|uniref:Ferric reductase NAD binding domain-containing protein n=1 Tax=Colocasia esculenta TaxID=4460 RepID=A0A843THM5_COLES|nr:hypothetical protein [Colocasia esculenta]